MKESSLIKDHPFKKKEWAEAAWNMYGSELAADIGYCEICNHPPEEHEDWVGHWLRKVVEENRKSSQL